MENYKREIIHLSVLRHPNEEPEMTGPCSLCGRVNTLVEMRSLPEVEEYARQVGSAIANNKPFPNSPKEETLMARYGYGIKAIFCEDCLKKVLAKTFVGDIQKAGE